MLSSPLFLVLLDGVTCESYGSEKTGTRQLEDIEFVDNLCFVSHKVAHMRQKVNTLKINAERVGHKINVDKTKEMRVKTPANDQMWRRDH